MLVSRGFEFQSKVSGMNKEMTCQEAIVVAKYRTVIFKCLMDYCDVVAMHEAGAAKHT